jgi:hypothetical protein
MKPIDYPVVATGHDAMHVQHKYWSRKPANVIKAHIGAMTEAGDVVLDPFCGSGTTVSQALVLGRKVVGSDLNPVATFITRNTIARAELDELLVVYDGIKTAVSSDIEALYRTRCHNCLHDDTTRVTCVHWKVHHPIKIYYTCTNCSGDRRKPKQLKKVPDAEDLLQLERIDAMDIPWWYPARDIPPGMVFNQARRRVTTFAELFTRRNLAAIAMIWDQIGRLPEDTDSERTIKDLYRFSFTSMVHLCSKMTPLRPSRPYSSFWATNSYWLPDLFMESNAWEKFESAILGPQGLLAAKGDANRKIAKDTSTVVSFDALSETPAPCAFITEHDATRIDELVPPASIDYIFTDPPYAGSIPYLELSTLWACWLGIDEAIPFDQEILVDKPRGKDDSYYQEKMALFFQKALLVLKPGKYLTFTYHNLDATVRAAVLRAAVGAGFELESIVYQPPPRPSPAHTLRPFNSAVGDYVIHLRKPELGMEASRVPDAAETVSNRQQQDIVEEDIINAITDYLVERGEPAPFTSIINSIDVVLARKSWFLEHSVDTKHVMKKYEGTCFTRVQEKIGQKRGAIWWLAPEYLANMLAERGIDHLVPLTNRLKSYMEENRATFRDFTRDDVLKAIFDRFHGASLPDAKTIDRLLGH